MNRITSEFNDFEKDNDLFNFKVYEIELWDFIRVSVLSKIKKIKAPETFSINPLRETPIRTSFHKVIQFCIAILDIKKNLIRKRTDIIFLGHPRRQKIGKKFEEIYCDNLIDILNKQYSTLLLEVPFVHSHYKPSKTKNIKYLDFIEIGRSIIPFFSNIRLSKKENFRIHEISEKLNEKFDVDLDLALFFEKALKQYIYCYPRINRIVKRTNPSLLISVDGYNFVKKLFTKIANLKNITTIELQHGTIGKNHIGYNYPKGIQPDSFSKYFFAWGEYWHHNTNFPEKIKIVNTGYPFIDKMKQEMKIVQHKDKKRNILVISQWTIGFELLSHINIYAKSEPTLNFFFKLHPMEFKAKNKYLDLVKSHNITILSDEKNIYELFNSCSIQVGVYSTALVEGLAFELKTIIVPLSGHDTYNNLIGKVFHLVKDEKEFSKIIDNSETRYQTDEFWVPNALNNSISEIESILH